MKLKKPRKPKIPKLPLRKKKSPLSKTGVPYITNESIAAHREAVLGSARKYIYPLRHSKHRVVKISVALVIVAVIGFLISCVLALYKFQSTSTFMYGVTRVLPFPVAKAGNSFVSYDSYLFELRHYMHYYQTQQGVNFSTDDDKRQLENFKKQSLDQVIDDAYIKQLAQDNRISVSSREVDAQVELVRNQNRLGASNQVFRNVLQEYWGWSVNDFKRKLRSELLEQKVIAKLDTATTARANGALAKLNTGTDFATLAAQVSDDTSTKVNGGEYGFLIDRASRDISPQAVDALFRLQPGQYSGVINSGYYLEIDKVLEKNGEKLRAAHITFNFADADTYLKLQKSKHPAHHFISVKD